MAFTFQDDDLTIDDQEKKCQGGRGGWRKAKLANLLHQTHPGFSSALAHKLNKSALCQVLKIGSDVSNSATQTMRYRLTPLNEIVERLGFHLGDVALGEITSKPVCLPDKRDFRIVPSTASGKSGASIFMATFLGQYDTIIKAAQVSSRLNHHVTQSAAGREAWIHARLSDNILFSRHAPGLLGHGCSYLCKTAKVKDALKLKGHLRTWTLMTYMEKGAYTLFRHLYNNSETLDNDAYRALFFKILFTLATITHRFKRFRHNDLHAGNILLVSSPTVTHETFEWPHDEPVQWYLPPSGHTPAIYDFGFAYLEPGQPYGAEFEYRAGMSSKVDRYYDLHTFFNNILNVVHEFSLELPTETRNFIEHVVPPVLQISHRPNKKRREIITEDLDHGRFWYGREPREAPRTQAYIKRMTNPNMALSLIKTHPYFAQYRQKPADRANVSNIWRA